jgi:lysozyme
MQTSESGFGLIKRFEGFSASAYDDAAGHPTIGYGHRLKPEENFQTVSEEEALALLAADAAVAEHAIARLVTAELVQPQFDALVSFIYNIGVQAFEKSYLLRLLNEGGADAAAAQLSRWVFAGGKPQAALIARRRAEKALFLNVTALS